MPHRPDVRQLARVNRREVANRVELTGRDDLEGAKNRVMKTIPQLIERPKTPRETLEHFRKSVMGENK